MTLPGYAETMPATKVLLIGSRWEPLNPALKALSGQGNITFVGPSDPHTFPAAAEIVSQVEPGVIIIGPGGAFEIPDPAALLVDDSSDPPPVLVCVTLEDLENDALALGGGNFANFDDFLVVPCSAVELESRLRRLVRKNATTIDGGQLVVGNIILDPTTYQVRLEGRTVVLAWMEFQLLKFLMENLGRVFTRESLLSSVWGFDSFGGTRTVDVHIRKLRSKLEIHGESYFRTVKNVGYGMITPL